MPVVLSPMHILLVLIVLATALIPIQQIVHRAGHSRWWSLLLFVPMVNWIGIWLLAYVRWPSLDKSGS